MKKLLFVLLLPIVFVIYGCQDKVINSDNRYETMYRDSFDYLINRLNHEADSLDTLYTEMYIAIKSIWLDRNTVSQRSCSIVIDRANRLLSFDTIFSNRIEYYDAMQIAYSSIRDSVSFWKTARASYDEYPENSPCRLNSIALYSLRFNQLDSAEYYGKRSLFTSDSIICSHPADEELLYEAYLNVFMSLGILNRYQEVKTRASHYLEFETNDNMRELIMQLSDNETNLRDLISVYFK